MTEVKNSVMDALTRNSTYCQVVSLDLTTLLASTQVSTSWQVSSLARMKLLH